MQQAVLVVSPDLGDGLKAVNIGTEFLVDKFEEVRDTERDTLLNKLGILTANTDKRERVQSAEVNATIGQATDYIYNNPHTGFLLYPDMKQCVNDSASVRFLYCLHYSKGQALFPHCIHRIHQTADYIHFSTKNND